MFGVLPELAKRRWRVLMNGSQEQNCFTDSVKSKSCVLPDLYSVCIECSSSYASLVVMKISFVAGLKTLTKPPENLFRVRNIHVFVGHLSERSRALNNAPNSAKRVNILWLASRHEFKRGRHLN